MFDPVVAQIRRSADIVAIIGQYTELRKMGRHFVGRCPFHKERTPSFSVDPEQKVWLCRGACGTGGDVFTFVQRIDGLTFPQARERLAGMYGIPLDDDPARRAEIRAIAAKAKFAAMDCEWVTDGIRRHLLRRAGEIVQIRNQWQRRVTEAAADDDSFWQAAVLMYGLEQAADRLAEKAAWIADAEPAVAYRAFLQWRKGNPPSPAETRARTNQDAWHTALDRLTDAVEHHLRRRGAAA